MARPPISKTAVRLLFVLTLGGPAIAQENVQTLNGHQFQLPAGFQIELAASSPRVERPITADFDEQGRLYVAESSGCNDPVQQQLAERPHRILRLEDRDGDGQFDHQTVFADRMMFPEGTMWFEGSLYVAAPPQIWKLTDTNDDGVADDRVVWFDGKTLTGCANDLHGPYRGPDGWIYWCKGAFAEQSYDRPGQAPWVTRASHIFRARPDGSAIEPVMTGGMDNPVDVVFTPSGDRIFTTTFLVNPAGGLRDGLIHAILGGVYGKVHDPIFSHPWTAPEVMPVLDHLGPAAPAGLARYESSVFGPEFRNNLFAALFNLHKITRHHLSTHGSSLQSETSDFLVSDRVDFHPTDVLEDADGSLLVIDTGGWYKLCCPTSQFHKPDILGAIYRIRRTDASPINDPRGLKLDWNAGPKALADRLADPRPTVSRRATEALARLGEPAVAALLPALDADQPPAAQLAAVWTLARIPGDAARAGVRQALGSLDPTVRHAALNIVSLWKDPQASQSLLTLLESGDLTDRRLAAEGLGRIGDSSAVPPLLQAAAATDLDRPAEHAITYALLSIADSQALALGLHASSPRTRRAALIALDQMQPPALAPAPVVEALSRPDPLEHEAALWIATRHPEWAPELVEVARQWIAQAANDPAAAEQAVDRIARFLKAPEIQNLLTETLTNPSASPATLQTAMRVLACGGLQEIPGPWAEALAVHLDAPDPAIRSAARQAVRALPLPNDQAVSLSARLLELASNPDLPDSERLDAARSIPGPGHLLPDALVAFLTATLDPNTSLDLRQAAVEALTRAQLSDSHLHALANSLGQVGPLELNRLLPLFESSQDPRVGQALVQALASSRALGSLRPDDLRPLLARFGAPIQADANALLQAMQEQRAQQAQRLESLLTTVSEGDVRRGQQVFHSDKAACSSCHAIGYVGGKIGPDLTRIGQIREERDLLEAIVFPSASLVRSYEPIQVACADGRVFNGLLKSDSGDELILTLGANEETRIPKDQVEEIQPGTVSIMPAGLDQQLTPAELADLVMFLKACK